MTTAEHVASYVDDAETSCTAHEAHALQLLDALLQQPEDGRERWLALQDVHPAVAAIALDLASAADRTSGLLERTVLGGAASAAALPPIDGALAALTTNYVIGEEIGRGGMARVFRARERKHDREVVVKLFAPIAGNAHGTERFLREVRIIAALAHPHIVPLIDSGAVHGRPYYVMPHLAGESMRARLHRGTRSSDEVIGVLRDVADALAFAHEAGVVHRDLKPENVLWASGHAYLLDFGIAKRLGHGSGEYATSPGFVLGTRRYMAPEQVVHPNQVGPSADCYAFGLLAYELLAGDTPPVAEARTFALGHLPAVRRDVSPALLSLIADCLHEDVQQRPESMAVVRARLDAIVVRAPTVRRRWSARHLLMTAVLMLSVVGTALGVRRLMTPVDDGPLGLPIAVATLRNETGDSTLTGITRFAGDWLTEGLQHVRGARVVPWATTSHLSDVAAAQGRVRRPSSPARSIA
ncbi:MAG: serine/threonine protein kinase [Gemmatimonadaceae bacterium]|nr:serine/threonine protein kinase [Gemmatimonadaceae bacterium]